MEFDIRLKKMFDELFLDFSNKSEQLNKDINKLKENKNLLFNTIANNPRYYNKNFINIIDNLKIINNDLNLIKDRMENVSYNIQNDLLHDCSDELIIKKKTEKKNG